MILAFDARMATWGGVGTYTRELLGALARDHAALGLERILAFHAPEDGPLAELAGHPAVEWRAAPGSPWSPAANARLGLAARGRADVFHAPHFPVPLGFGRPLVTTIHDLIPLLIPDSMPDPKRRAVYSGMVRWAVTQSDVVICGTRAAARTVIQRYGDTRVCVVHHGMGIASSSAVEGAADLVALGRHGLRPGYVLWVGAFKPHKDVPTALAAHRRLPPEVRDRHPLVLVGDDQTAAGRMVRSELLGSPAELGRQVHLLGRVAPADLPPLFKGAGVFVFPSLIEGFGLPPLEAMAYGVPVVSSRAAPMPEVLGDAASYFAPGNAEDLAARLLRVLANPAATAHLRARGAARARRYSWERAAAGTVAAYGLAVGVRPSPLDSTS
ncbi:MAG: glycosyltransferase family 4 protein [Thermoleophilia bacterium]